MALFGGFGRGRATGAGAGAGGRRERALPRLTACRFRVFASRTRFCQNRARKPKTQNVLSVPDAEKGDSLRARVLATGISGRHTFNQRLLPGSAQARNAEGVLLRGTPSARYVAQGRAG